MANIFLRRVLVAALALVLHLGEAAAQEKRVALLIGNSSYTSVPVLRNPANDASDIAEKLTKLDFEVTLALDASLQIMQKRLADFVQDASDADLAFIYFAGHGIEINGANYLIPVNADLHPNEDAAIETLPLTTILHSISGIKAAKIVLVDACRNNPFVAQLEDANDTRSFGRGLIREDQSGGIWASNVLVGYAAKEGTVALDGEGRNSPYAQAILEYLEQPGLEVGKLFRKVGDRVLELTSGRQEPFTYGALRSEDIFLLPAVVGPETETFSGQEQITRLSAAFVRAERLNTIINWERFLESYAEIYPGNQLVRSAQKKLEELQEDARRARSVVWLDATYDATGAAVLDREQIRLLQMSLLYSGFDPGTPDGAVGPRTRRAIAAARMHHGLPIGEIVDEHLLKRLIDPNPVLELRSDISRVYSAVNLSDVLEPRLKRVIELLPGYHYIFDYFEGRLYVAVRNDNSSPGLKLTWEMASQLAQAAGGHLATITSSAENDFIYRLFSRDPMFTLERNGNIHGPGFGLFQINNSSEPSGGWTWINGEAASFTKWAPGQPNDFGGIEHYGEFFSPGRQRTGPSGPQFWNDATLGVGRNSTDHTAFSGFIFEVD